MKRSVKVVLSTALAAVAVLVVVLLKQTSAEIGNFAGEPFPAKPMTNIILPSKETGKSFILQRYKMVKDPEFSQEWRQLDSATILWDESHQSLIEDQEYFPDQTVSKSTKHFPGTVVEERGGLRRIAYYDTDGTFLKHQVYRKDGTLERQGEYVKSPISMSKPITSMTARLFNARVSSFGRSGRRTLMSRSTARTG